MSDSGLRPYLPLTIATIIVVALIALGYFAGYRAGMAAGARTHYVKSATRR